MGKMTMYEARALISRVAKHANEAARHRGGSAGVTELEDMVAKKGEVPFILTDTTYRKEVDEIHEFQRQSIADDGWDVDLSKLPKTPPIRGIVPQPPGEMWTQDNMQVVLLLAFGEDGEPGTPDDSGKARHSFKLYWSVLQSEVNKTKTYDALTRGFTKERKMISEIVDSVGPAVAFAMLGNDKTGQIHDDKIEILNLEKWRAASQVQKSVDMVDDFANQIISALGIDIPKFENDILKAQANYLIDNHNDAVDYVCELVEEAAGGDEGPGTAFYLKKEAYCQTSRVMAKAKLFERNMTCVQRDMESLILGLDDADVVGADDGQLPGVTNLRELSAAFTRDRKDNFVKLTGDLKNALKAYDGAILEDFTLEGPSGAKYNLSGPQGGDIVGLQKDIRDFHRLSDSETIEDPTGDVADLPADSDPSGE